ncbi:MAG: efflux RND transporter periplasmic adaptor subunit, partial [Myxococcota bacterium]
LDAPKPRREWSRIVPWVLVVAVLGILVVVYLKSVPETDSELPTTVVERGTVVQQAVVVGRIVPRTMVNVKATTPGILNELKVLPGALVKRGDLLATVRPVADPVSLANARARIEQARLGKEAAARELDRLQSIRGESVLAQVELDSARDALKLAEVELGAAQQALRLIAEGSSQGKGQASTNIFSPMNGTVLDTPVVVGTFVSETSPFRDGTTVAVVANMGDLLFKGQVDESRVAELKVGMPLRIQVGARAHDRFDATLEYIAPLATIRHSGITAEAPPRLEELPGGVTKFQIWGAVPGHLAGQLRAGYSATAEIELERRENVLVLDEGALRFRDGRTHVLLRTLEPQLSERDVEVGLSDGIKIEIISGLELGDRVALNLQR